MTNNAFTICSLFYSILLLIVYFNRERIKTYETTMYSSLIVLNLLNVIFALSTYYIVKYLPNLYFLYYLIPKLLLISYMAFLSVFTLYVIHISFSKKKKKQTEILKKSSKYILMFFLFSMFMI